MFARCPDGIPKVTASLHGWRLTFRGVADIEAARDRTVHGALWSLTDEDMLSLDRYEGAPTHYRRVIVEVESAAGPQEAITYVMTDDKYLGLPSGWYLNRIELGYRDWGLPLGELERSVRGTHEMLTEMGIDRYHPDGRKRLRAVI